MQQLTALPLVTASQADALCASIGRLEPMAENEIEQVGKILEQLPLTHRRQDVEEMTKRIVEGVNHVVDFLGAIAQMHPWAGFAVDAFSKFIKLEIQRHENDAHIIVVHTTMVKTVYHLNFLSRVQVDKLEKDLEGHMAFLLDNMVKTIRDFGAFVDTYHLCWQKTYKLLFSHIHKKKLENFSGRFEKHREDLDEMRKTVTQMQLSVILANTESLLGQLRIDDPDLKQAEAYMIDKGGPEVVMQDPNLIDGMAELLQEKATPRMKEILRRGFDDLLEEHTARYLLKLNSVQDSILASVTSSQTMILGRLNEGPHDLIEDEEIRSIWKRNVSNIVAQHWKSSVKSRVFVAGLHEHYQRVFQGHDSPVAHDDAWTLEFFSRVMYHSAIGDIADDDGSGYISASEVNDFISQKRSLSHWSKPEWFAFWACGWYNNNALYYRRIKHVVQEVVNLVRSAETAALAHGHGSWHLLRVITESLEPLVLIADVEDFSGTLKVPHQLRRLQDEYRRHEEERLNANLDRFGCHLVDKSSLRYVVGDARIELHMMPLLYILMSRFHKIVAEVAHQKHIKDDKLIAIEELATSSIAVCAAFEDRMSDLVRGWRFESKDIGVQIDRYADGLFRKCYLESERYEKAYDTLRGCLFGEEHTLPRHLRPFGLERRTTSPPDDLVRKLSALTERVKALESGIGTRGPVPLVDVTSEKSVPQSPQPSNIKESQETDTDELERLRPSPETPGIWMNYL
ncbi:hypothetical protein BD413DRAFT_670879 [Trametes elegans]|nr:hypothetical protein BD413DRAFT_670879 [Trametes elegans]